MELTPDKNGLLEAMHVVVPSHELHSIISDGLEAGRPFPTPADPATWAAVQACLAHRDQLATLNPHLIVTVRGAGYRFAEG